MVYVLDTHVLKWLYDEPRRLSRRVARELSDAANTFIVPTVALAELHALYQSGKFSLSVTALLERLRPQENYRFAAFDVDLAAKLPGGLELHDAIIVATALLLAEQRGHAVPLISCDGQITASGLVPVVW